MLATAATILTCLLVAALASRPESPLTPQLLEGNAAPRWLAGLASLLGLDGLERDVAGTISAVFLVAAAVAFVFALRESWAGRLSLRRVLLVGLALHALAAVVPLFLSRDVYSYAIYGRMVSLYGANPYTEIPASFFADPFNRLGLVSVDWLDSPSVYGPAWSWLAAGVTGLFRSPAATVTAFKLVAVMASAATMILAALAALRLRPERAAFAAAMVGWNPVVLFHGAAGAHNDAVVGLAVAAGVVLLIRGRDLWATAALVVGSLIKISAAIPLAALVLASVLQRPPGRRWPRLAAHAGVAVVVALPLVLPFLQSEDPTLGTLELVRRQGWLAPSRFVLVVLRGAARFLGGEVAGSVMEALVRVVFPAVFLVVLWALARHLTRDRERIGVPLAVATMGWASLVSLMVAPVLLPWYAAWVVPLAWALPRTARWGTILVSVGLAITELVAEPSRAPRVWEVMVFGLHYVATPIVLGVLVWLLVSLRRRLRLGPGSGWADPLLAEELRLPD
jgi:hypothetical protein